MKISVSFFGDACYYWCLKTIDCKMKIKNYCHRCLLLNARKFDVSHGKVHNTYEIIEGKEMVLIQEQNEI